MPIEVEIPQERAASEPKTAARDKRTAIELPAWFGRSGITDKERMFFTEQLALLLETGATLQQALATMAQHAHRPALHKMLTGLESEVSSGKAFSQALAAQPEVFSPTYVSLVAASEDGGFLDKVLAQILEMEEKREQLRSTVMSALSYPAFLTLFSFAVVVFVLVVVFPKFGTMFAAIHDQLPATTRGLMWLSDVLRFYWMYVVGGIVGLAIGVRQWAVSERGKTFIDQAKVTVPGIRDVIIQIYLVQSLRVMSLSLTNGVSLVDTLASCKDVVRNRVFRKLFAVVELRVQQGAGVSSGFRESDLLPPLVTQMITTGEESGNLPKVMGRMADFYERELGKRLTTLSKMAEPLMLMVMGLVVGIIVSSLILPIFKLSRAVS